MEITLTKNQIAIVDEADADLATNNWQAKASKKPLFPFCAKRTLRLANAEWATEWLHRTILSRVLGRPLLEGEYVDHENGDGLDNRRSNLRLATPSQNACNRINRRDNASGFKGVALDGSKWRARIQVSGKTKSIGLFASIIDAAIAYDRAAFQVHGEFANTNYPRFACGLEQRTAES